MSTTLETSLLSAFLKTYSEDSTRNTYRRAIGQISNYCDKDFIYLEIEDVKKYHAHLFNRYHAKSISMKTIAAKFSYFRSYASFLARHLEEYDNPFIWFDLPKKDDSISSVHIPSLQELDRLLQAVKNDMQLMLIFLLALRMGLTSSEIVSIRKSMVLIQKGSYAIHFPGRKERVLLVPSDLTSIFSLCYQKATDYFFLNEWGNPLKQRSLINKVSSVMEQVNLSYTLKDLRSRAVVEMLLHSEQQEVMDYAGLSLLQINNYSKACTFVKETPAENSKLKVIFYE